jgi:hypothetical protein
VRVARHDVEVAVVGVAEGLVVDPAGVHLAEAELRPLGHEPDRPGGRLVVLGLHLVADGRAVDHHRCAFDGLTGLVLRDVPELLEVIAPFGVDGQHGSTPLEVPDLAPLGQQWRPLVEGDLVDPEVVAVIGQQPDERLTDRPGTDDVDDPRHVRLRLCQNCSASVEPTSAKVDASPPATAFETASKYPAPTSRWCLVAVYPNVSSANSRS